MLLQDAVVAVWLIETSAATHTQSVLGGVLAAVGAPEGGCNQPFPDDPDREYAALQEALVAAVRGVQQRHLLTY